MRCFGLTSSRYVAFVILFMSMVVFVVMLGTLSVGAEPPVPPHPPKGGILALPGYTYSFPRDHGSHDEFGLEWWYFTGHLLTESERRFGYELTFFRKAIHDQRVQINPSQWAIRQLYFAHLALTDVQEQTFHFAEKLSRAGLGKAGAQPERMEVWIDQWSLKPTADDHQQLHLEAADEHFGIDLMLTLQKQPIIHGQEGISRKGAETGQASHYYSLPRLATKGKLSVGSEQIEVTGLSWMDHEFGSGDLGEDQVGWDWFSIQLDSDTDLMVYLLRRKDGTSDPASSGTIIFANGKSRHLQVNEITVRILGYWQSPHSGARYPAEWNLEVPSAQLHIRVKPVQADQELRTAKSTQVTYWEGAVDVQGQHQGLPIKGKGYVELTGYAKPLKMTAE